MSPRLLIPAAVVAGLLVIVGVASRGRPLSPHAGAGPSASFFDYVGTTLVLFAIGMVIVVVAAIISMRGGDRQNVDRSPWYLLSSLIMFFVCCALAFLVSRNAFLNRIAKPQSETLTQRTATSPTPSQKALKGTRNPHFRWDELALVVLLIGGVGIYLWRTRAPRLTPRPLAMRRRTALSRAVDDSIDDLRRDPDIRRAIIAAYARMERTLGAAGVPRRPSEAPFEYLERSLVELETSADAARGLTGLFERAKFSQHEPAESMRDEAIDALVAVRDELQHPAREAVPA
ncbi:MAG TPA: DUF4129 domain-containing protein [Gaiellaceae bacterium]